MCSASDSIVPSYNLQSAIIEGGSFSWAEFTFLRGFKHYAKPTPTEYENAIVLFSHLQPLRERLGKPLIITSGVRTKAYTDYLRRRGIPAALQSAHLTWQAVDLVCPQLSASALWSFMHPLWEGRMEDWRDTPGWVHLDTRQWGQKIRFRA